MFCRGCSSLERVGRDSIILMEASVRLRNLGRTSPSSPAASSSAASHSDRTVPTSWAKHSVHVRSGLGLPSVVKCQSRCARLVAVCVATWFRGGVLW